MVSPSSKIQIYVLFILNPNDSSMSSHAELCTLLFHSWTWSLFSRQQTDTRIPAPMWMHARQFHYILFASDAIVVIIVYFLAIFNNSKPLYLSSCVRVMLLLKMCICSQFGIVVFFFITLDILLLSSIGNKEWLNYAEYYFFLLANLMYEIILTKEWDANFEPSR